MHLGIAYYFARQYDKAIQQYERTLALNSNYASAWVQLGNAYFYLGKYEDATRAYGRSAELTDIDKELFILWSSLAEKYARTGESVTPPPELEKFAEKHRWAVFLYAQLGQKEKTLALIEQVYKEKQYTHIGYLKVAPRFDFLRSEPRFIALLQKMGLEE